jgi:hypothetical protein
MSKLDRHRVYEIFRTSMNVNPGYRERSKTNIMLLLGRNDYVRITSYAFDENFL